MVQHVITHLLKNVILFQSLSLSSFLNVYVHGLASHSWRTNIEPQYVVVSHESLQEFENELHNSGKQIHEFDRAERVPVTYLNGKQMVCFLPHSGDSNNNNKKNPDQHSTKSAERSSSFPITKDEIVTAAGKRLRTLKEKCITSAQGYWSYSVCPFSHVRQFHNHGKKKADAEFNLGRFNDTELMSVPKYISDSGQEFDLYSQHFSGGTDGRNTQVHFVCKGSALDPTLKQNANRQNRQTSISRTGSLIAHIQEDPMYTYHITVAVEEVCGVSETPQQLIASSPMKCFRHVGSWWTAEVCPFQQVRQYHKEIDGSRTQILLGMPTHGALIATVDQASEAAFQLTQFLKWPNNAQDQSVDDLIGGDPLPYFEEVFTDGSPCGDASDARRRATVVRYTCDARAAHQSSEFSGVGKGLDTLHKQFHFRSIDSFEEVGECLYKIVVRLPELCVHPAFEHLVATPDDSDNIAQINCLPADVVSSAAFGNRDE